MKPAESGGLPAGLCYLATTRSLVDKLLQHTLGGRCLFPASLDFGSLQALQEHHPGRFVQSNPSDQNDHDPRRNALATLGILLKDRFQFLDWQSAFLLTLWMLPCCHSFAYFITPRAKSQGIESSLFRDIIRGREWQASTRFSQSLHALRGWLYHAKLESKKSGANYSLITRSLTFKRSRSHPLCSLEDEGVISELDGGRVFCPAIKK